jgi:hypothetical protein
MGAIIHIYCLFYAGGTAPRNRDYSGTSVHLKADFSD